MQPKPYSDDYEEYEAVTENQDDKEMKG